MMAKDKQQKHDVAETNAASSKIKRKEFEKDLAKLQELTRLQTWGPMVLSWRAGMSYSPVSFRELKQTCYASI
jgi:hypothetical protein